MSDADRRRGQIVVTGEPFRSPVGRIFGAEWTNAKREWSLPLSMRSCLALREALGADLHVGTALNRWAHTAQLKVRAPRNLGFAWEAAHDYQRHGIMFGDAMGNLLLADSPGLGKSLQSISMLIEREPAGVFLVLCPSVAIHATWAREVATWAPRAEVVVLEGPTAVREAVLAALVPLEDVPTFVITNIESVRWDHVQGPVVPALFRRTWDAVVIDESHRALVKTKRRVRINGDMKTVQTATREGCMRLKADRRVALSGTPMRGKPEQLWGTLNWLRPDEFTSYWAWAETYFRFESTQFNPHELMGFKLDGESMLAADISHMMIRRTKAEVAPELPPKTYVGQHLDPTDTNSPYGIWLESSGPQEDQLAELDRDAVVAEVTVDGVLADWTRRRQLAVSSLDSKDMVNLKPALPSNKLAWLMEFIAELDGAKVVVVSQFTAVIELFAEKVAAGGYTVASITGKTSGPDRAATVARFQDTTADLQVLFLNMKAGGVSLTLDAADYMVILDESTIPDDMEQVEDRIHRISRNHNVMIYILRTLGTVEEELAWLVAARGDVQRYLLDGTRGVEYAKNLYELTKGQK